MPAQERPATPICLFYSYSHRDEVLREKLETQLSLLRRQGVIRDWHDRRITAGTKWKEQIDRNLDTADVILLLVSADFIASDYCYDIEMKRALERHEAGTARVIPVILRPVDGWQSAPFGNLEALPKDGKPVTDWRPQDKAFADIARGIREAVKGLTSGAQNPPTPAQPAPVVMPPPAARPRSVDRPPPDPRHIAALAAAVGSLDFLADERNRAALLRELPPPFSLDLSAADSLAFFQGLARNALSAHPDLDPLLDALVPCPGCIE